MGTDKFLLFVDGENDIAMYPISRLAAITCAADEAVLLRFSSGVAGGTGASYVNIIERFPFASSAGVSDVGDLTGNITWGSGVSSTTNGYKCGGHPNGSTIAQIDNYSLASSASGADWGDLSVAAKYNAGCQF